MILNYDIMKFFIYFSQKTPLHNAVSLGNVDIINLLMNDKNIDINIRNDIVIEF